MKNRIIEICELGQPQSIIHRENEPITELIKTEVLIKELNEAINYTHSCEALTCVKCNGYGYTVDENGRRKDHCKKCDGWG